ncbi:unnamed protein product [Blepharisma stoltei]|uniref:Derlin n=1 Tax=Blepharisma stoltei TaxID=1481888 RepID=A0AAU9K9W1_9CILI|nr:unnamed protein product [Blepharisma stoltei]
MFFSDPNQDVGARLKYWWQNIPAYTRLILYISIFVYILSWLPIYIDYAFISSPQLTLTSFQLWRLFTFPYVPISILDLIFEMISFLFLSCKIERKYGTSKYFMYFFINNALIALSMSLIFMLISCIPIDYLQGLAYYYLAGLWPIIMMEIVIRCNKNPEASTQFFFIPIQIKSKYFPFVMTAIFCLLGVFWELIFGLLFGYLHVYGILKFTILSDEFASRLEDSVVCLGLRKLPHFIENAMAGDEELPSSQTTTQQAFPQVTSPQNPPSAPQPAPFSGQGYRLGGDEQSKGRNYDKLEESAKEEELF